MPLDALVVLGCRAFADGAPGPALAGRLERAIQAFRLGKAPYVVLSGGRTWGGIAEAEVLRRAWVSRGLPPEAVVLELESQTTLGNARHSATIFRERGWHRAGIVTCDFHLRRALRHFRAQGLEVEGFASKRPARLPTRVRRSLREWGATLLEPFAPDARR